MKKINFTKMAVTGTEWFSGLAVLNIYWLLFSLPIITIIPATDTVFHLVNQWYIGEQKPVDVFGQFKYHFKHNFQKSFQLGVPYFLLLIVIVVDIVFLKRQSSSAEWFQIFRYSLYTLSVIATISLLYAYPLSKKLTNISSSINLLLVGFVLAIKNLLLTFSFIVTLFILFLVLLRWPAMILFFSVSGIAFVATAIVSNITEV